MKQLDKVIYTDNNAHALADANIEAWYHFLLKTDTLKEINISTDLQLARLRLGFLQKEISPFILKIQYIEYKIDENGL